MLPQFCKHGVSVHLWKHDVEDDDVRIVFVYVSQSSLTVDRLDGSETLSLEIGTHDLTNHRLIVNDENAAFELGCLGHAVIVR